MGWIDNKKSFNIGLYAYLLFFLPEAILLLNVPLNVEIFKFGLGGPIENLKNISSNIYSNIILTIFFVLFIFRLIYPLYLNAQSKSQLIKEHCKWLVQTYLIYTTGLVMFVISIFGLVKINGDNEPNLLIVLFTLISCLILFVNFIYFFYREIRGFMKFMEQESPYRKKIT